MIWPDDVPVEIQLSVRPAKAPEPSAPKLSVVPNPGNKDKSDKRKAKRAAKKAELRVAEPPKEQAPDDAPIDSPSPPTTSTKKPKRELPPYLRVVK